MTTERTGTLVGNGLRGAGRTDCGLQRTNNEDQFMLDLQAGVFLVVDGVGGQAAGEVAAAIACETIRKRLDRPEGSAEVRIREAITLANQQILTHTEGSPELQGMACVLTLGVLEGRRLTVGHVGDTRLYKLTTDGITKLTHDHSPIGEREDAREISETQAMQHARRNEVYRDVGSTPREPEDPDFIEVMAVTVEEDWALLLCSDGLSDMLPSTEILRLVRAHAGEPSAVVDALIDGANRAGGRDNITAVYLEAPRFARSARGALTVNTPLPVAPPVATEPLYEFDGEPSPSEAPAPRWTRTRGRLAPLLGSRAFFLVAGALIGAAAAFGMGQLNSPTAIATPSGPRTLTVGGTTGGAFQNINAALAEARDGDTIHVHPGRYTEALEIRRNVALISIEPRGAILDAPAETPDAFASVTSWSANSVLRGFRITGTAPGRHVGVRTHAGKLEIDDVSFHGALEIAVDVAGVGSEILLRGSRFDAIEGLPMQVAEGARAVVRQNVFLAASSSVRPAIAVGTNAGLTLDTNTFVDFLQPLAFAGPVTAVPDPRYVIPRVTISGGRAR